MTTTAAIIIICILAAVAIAFAYVLAMPSAPDFRTIEDMNRDEAERAQARKVKAYIDGLWDVQK